jgi:hypothetical protein
MIDQRATGTAYQAPSPAPATATRVEGSARGADCQSRLDKIEFLIGIYRMRYMHYVWHDHLPEAGEMERKIDRLLERWQRVHNRELANRGTRQ